MSNTLKLKLILGLTSSTCLITVLLVIIFIYLRRRAEDSPSSYDIEKNEHMIGDNDVTEEENLVVFQGGEDLTISEILEAPGEVIWKSNYGTLYKAFLQRTSSILLLRFLRPACISRVEDFDDVIRLLGGVRHPNLVPLSGFYYGSRGEKLLVHPYFRRGDLAQFIRDGTAESHKWTIIYKIAHGIVKGLEYLHTGIQKPIIHGNLKSKNILLDLNYQPYISDFGLHLLLNPTAGQQMLEASAAEGYRAPEHIKMKDASQETDIYNLGIILLELLSGKEPITKKPNPDEDFYLPTFMRNAVNDRRISNLYHPDLLLSNDNNNEVPISEERAIRFFQLAMSCCSPSPSLRPNIKQLLWKLEEIER